MSSSESRLKEFLKEDYALILEPSVAFSSSLQACLIAMGIGGTQILIARRFEDAVRMIAEKKPRLLVTEYQVEQEFGLALVERLEKYSDESARICIVATKSSSDSVVAEAAEEKVDAFLLKPFSVDTFQQKLNSVLDLKCRPSPYIQRIRTGKALFQARDYAKAVEEFSKAKALTDKPALACYYSGAAFQKMGLSTRALEEFREGRRHQSLHYKCLIGEFEALMAAKLYDPAYQLVAVIKNNFPLTPSRLNQIFIAAVFTRHFEDIASYFNLFVRLTQRPAELIKIASMAMLMAGRHFLEQKDNKAALDVFDKGALVVGRDFSYLERVTNELIRMNAEPEAREFLSKVPPSTIGSPEYNRLVFKLDQLTLKRDQLVERGRKLVMEGQGSPEIFQMVVKLMAEEGKMTLAESVISRALGQFPDLRTDLYRILEESAAKA